MIKDSQFGFYYNNNQSLIGTTTTSSARDKESSMDYAPLFNHKNPSIDSTLLNPPPFIPQPGASAFPANYTTSSSSNPQDEAGSSDDGENDAVLRYISQVLMEEDMDQNPCMLQDALTLQAAEKPFYDVLGETYPSSPNQHPLILHQHHSLSPEDNVSASAGYTTGGKSSDNNTGPSTANSYSSGMFGSVYSKSFAQSPPFQYPTQPLTTSTSPVPFTSSTSAGSVPVNHTGFSDRDSIIQFQRGLEEARKFLPKATNLLVNLDHINYRPEETRNMIVVFKPVKEEYITVERFSRAREVHYLDEGEGRRTKQSAFYVEETDELTELFQKVLLSPAQHRQEGRMTNAEDKRKEHNHRKGGGGDSRTTADLRTLLILCAQSAASDERRTADELLKQIRRHSSPKGDASQRVAHLFANALEARLSGTGSQIYRAMASNMATASEMIKAYQLYASCCPFRKISYLYANNMILKFAEKCDKLHIIDFGIQYGFQWPALIQKLSEREGGPAQLKITGIELPQPGFRPTERVEATGQRLAKCCEKFNVLFKYHAVAQKWETIKVSDLSIEPGEIVVVNTIFRMENLLDETIMADSPRNAVLKLIRDIKPNMFVQGITNALFNSPFFMTRFRELLFFYSSMFDMVDSNISREHPLIMMYERELHGRQIMNVVACEGIERVERHETYKQWQIRNRRAGFKQMKLDEEMVKKIRNKVKQLYHKDFLVDVDGNWVLQGWKGLIHFASTVWIPC